MYAITFWFCFRSNSNDKNDQHSDVEFGPAQILRRALYGFISLLHWCTRPLVIPLSLSCLVSLSLFSYICIGSELPWFPDASF